MTKQHRWTDEDPRYPKGDPRRQKNTATKEDLRAKRFLGYVDDELLKRAARRRADEIEKQGEYDEDLFAPVDLSKLEDVPPSQLGPENIFPLEQTSLLIGKENIGKSPLICYCAIQMVRASPYDNFGIYEDEMGARRIRRLLQELGATKEEMQRIIYLGTDGRPEDLMRHSEELADRAEENECSAVGFDSLVSMLAASNLDENSSIQVRSWFNTVPRRINGYGAYVIVADHNGNRDPERARGSSDKAKVADFVVYMEEKKAGRRGHSGEYTLKCIKDRNSMYIGSVMTLEHHASVDGTFIYEPQGWKDLDLEGIEYAQPKTTTQGQIWDALEGGPMRPVQMAKLLGKTEKSISMALSRGKEIMFVQMGNGQWDRLYSNGNGNGNGNGPDPRG